MDWPFLCDDPVAIASILRFDFPRRGPKEGEMKGLKNKFNTDMGRGEGIYVRWEGITRDVHTLW